MTDSTTQQLGEFVAELRGLEVSIARAREVADRLRDHEGLEHLPDFAARITTTDIFVGLAGAGARCRQLERTAAACLPENT